MKTRQQMEDELVALYADEVYAMVIDKRIGDLQVYVRDAERLGEMSDDYIRETHKEAFTKG